MSLGSDVWLDQNETFESYMAAATEDRDHTTIYTIADLAKLWKCSKDVIYDMLLSGRLKGFKVGRQWRISYEARMNYEHNSEAEHERPCPSPESPRVMKIH